MQVKIPKALLLHHLTGVKSWSHAHPVPFACELELLLAWSSGCPRGSEPSVRSVIGFSPVLLPMDQGGSEGEELDSLKFSDSMESIRILPIA